MTDAARTLLVACGLSIAAALVFLVRLRALEPDAPERAVGELRAAYAAALMLAVVGAIPIGFTLTHATAPTAALELSLALLFCGVAGVVLTREPREALWIAAIAFLAHAALDLAHRPGALSLEIFPHRYLIGCAVFNTVLAAACSLARQR